MNTTTPQVSVVVPVYRSEACVAELVQRVREAFAASGRSYELVLVNDGSPDASWARIRDAAQADPCVRGINLRRNFGQDNAIMAGLGATRGAVVVIMDDDLQHDPRDIDRLARAVEEGADVCYAHFAVKRQAFWKNAGSWLNDVLARVVLGKPRDIYLSPFKALAGDVARGIVDYDGPFPYVDGLLFRTTTNVTQVDVEHHPRLTGRGNYTLARSIGLWLRVATSFSLVPLRVATFLGFAFALVGMALAAYFVLEKLFTTGEPSGWASMIVAVLVLGGIQLACLGIVGEYLGRVFLHLNRRPQYVVKERAERT